MGLPATPFALFAPLRERKITVGHCEAGHRRDEKKAPHKRRRLGFPWRESAIRFVCAVPLAVDQISDIASQYRDAKHRKCLTDDTFHHQYKILET